MSAVYFGALKSLRGLAHDVLLDDQRRWLAVRDVQCSEAHNAQKDAEIAACLRSAIRRRVAVLRDFEINTRDIIKADLEAEAGTTRGQFAGDWSSCGLSRDGDYICEYKTLFQNGTRVCGWWHYWATGRDYDGRLVGAADGGKLILNAICGRPGSETQHDCPQWEASNKELRLCGDDRNFLTDGEFECARAIQARVALEKGHRGSNATLVDNREEDSDVAWIKSCLRVEEKFPASTVNPDK